MTGVMTAPDLTSRYLGFTLRTPIVASASPMSGDPQHWEALEQAGVGAVVLPSLFEEQIEHEAFGIDRHLARLAEVSAESASYFPDVDDYDLVPARHLSLVEFARQRLSVPVIASLNGSSPGGWVHYARQLVDAGAEAIELNIYDVVVDPRRSAADVERQYLEVVEEVRAEITVPLAVKLGPWFTALANFAAALQAAGVDGLVLFNRLYQPDIDLDTLQVTPRLQLSTAAEVRLPLHWIGILRGELRCSLAATSGVHEGSDAIKLLLAGADAVMTASAILRGGAERVAELVAALRQWMTDRGYSSVEQLKGSVCRAHIANPDAYERANYFQVLHSWTG